MQRRTAWVLLVIILLAAFFLYQYKLLDFPYYGDEVDGGDITARILNGQLAPFYPEGDGHEALYNYTMAPLFIVMGESVIASRWTSVAWAMVTVALMYVYGQRLFKSRRTGVLAAGLTAALFWPALYAHLSLRVVTLSAMMIPALIGLVAVVRSSNDRDALRSGVVGGAFAGLAAYTYTSGRGFPAIVVLFLLYLAILHRDLIFKRWRVLLVYIALLGIISVWLYVYLRMHPEFDNRIGQMAQTSWFFSGNWSGFLPALLDTLGMFTVRGEPNWVNNISGRPVFVGPEGILFYIGALICVVRVFKPEYTVQLIVLGVHLLPSIITEHPPSWGRSMGMLPALIVITVLPIEWAFGKLEEIRRNGLGVGWARYLQKRSVLPAYAVLVALLGVSVYGRTAYDLFEVWMNAPGVYWMSLAYFDETAKYVNRSPDSTPLDFNLDWYIPWRRMNLKRPIQRNDVALRWTVNNAFVFPDDPRGWRVAFQVLADPARPLQFTFLDLDHPIYTGERVDPEGQRPLRIYFIPHSKLDQHLDRARASLGGETAPQMGDTLQFLGYEIVNPDAPAGGELDVFTYWRVLAPQGDARRPDMAVFLHLLDGDQVISQYDSFDVVPDDLAANDIVVQLHPLKLPARLASTGYRFEIGGYTRADLQRLPLSNGADHLVLSGWQRTPAR